MSLTDVENIEELKKEFEDLDEQIKEERINKIKKTVATWGVSFISHAIVLMVMTFVLFKTTEVTDVELPPTIISILPTPPQKNIKEDVNKTNLIPNDIIIDTNSDVVSDNPLLTMMDDDERENINISENDSKTPIGNEVSISDMEMGGVGFLTSIGTGGNSSGIYGNRIGGNKIRTRKKYGPIGSRVDSSIERGLRWLKRHQDTTTGMWSVTKYMNNCTEGIKCEPGELQPGNADVAITGYAILCFLGSGYDHKTPNKFRNVVKSGINYLISIQSPDGVFGERNYEHAIATMAIVEAYGLTNDADIRENAQRGVDIILQRQARLSSDGYDLLGWNYKEPTPYRNDMSVCGWQIMTLKSAVGSGLNVGNSIEGSKNLIENAWKDTNKNWESLDPYTHKSQFPYVWDAVTKTVKKDNLSFVGATCAVFLGYKQGDTLLETLLNDSEERYIKSGVYKNHDYSSYYLSLAMFQSGGERWKLCLSTIIPYSVESQRVEENSCFDGSWEYSNQKWHGSKTGRPLSTVYNILNLQVAYRYAQVNKIPNPTIKNRK